ncbi:hypothetical protein [Rossellomorea marisflavi]
MNKKRYILFGFSEFYPSGGLEDVIETFNESEYEKFKEKIKSNPREAWDR